MDYVGDISILLGTLAGTTVLSSVLYGKILPLIRASRQSGIPLSKIGIGKAMDLGELIFEMTTWWAPEPSKGQRLKRIEGSLPEEVRSLLYRHLTDVFVGKRQRVVDFYQEPVVQQYLRN